MDHLQNVMGYFDQQQPLCAEHDRIAKDLYREFGVKAGLRDENGKGVLAGLTNISDIRAFQYVNGVKKPADGQLLYRGYDVKDLIRGSSGSRFAFEEAAYLLLFGELPTQEKLEEFCRVLGECRTMPTNFTRDVIMKAPSHDIMNSMARSVLTLASYDPMANDLDISNVLRQSIQLTGIFPCQDMFREFIFIMGDKIRILFFEGGIVPGFCIGILHIEFFSEGFLGIV